MSIHFHYRVRAIVIEDGKLLVMRSKGAQYAFVPGGHIELGEPAESALMREIQEELGEKSSIGSFLGAIEQGWKDEEGEQHEINLLFSVNIPGISAKDNPPAKEPGFEFFWANLQDLEQENVLPKLLPQLVRGWTEGKLAPIWGSHFE